MPKINLKFKIDFKRIGIPIKEILFKVPLFIAERSFMLFWVALVVIIGIDGIIFYQYLWKVDKQKIEIEAKEISINDEAYNAFLENYSSRKKIYNRGNIEIHNIFFR